jgi:hypothetical protein
MASAASLRELVQRFSALHGALPGLLFTEVPVYDGVLHIDEECPALSGIHFGVKFETRALADVLDELSCRACVELSERSEILEAVEEPLSEAVAVLVACESHDRGASQNVHLGSLINSLRASIWVRNPAIATLLDVLEARFAPSLPSIGTAWLVKRGAGAPLALLANGLHHASGYSVLLLPQNMNLLSTPSRPLSVREPFVPQMLSEDITSSELVRARELFFQMLTGGTDPSVALQAALAI